MKPKRSLKDLYWMLRVSFNDWRRGVTPGEVMTREVKAEWVSSWTTSASPGFTVTNTTWPISPDNPYA